MIFGQVAENVISPCFSGHIYNREMRNTRVGLFSCFNTHPYATFTYMWCVRVCKRLNTLPLLLPQCGTHSCTFFVKLLFHWSLLLEQFLRGIIAAEFFVRDFSDCDVDNAKCVWICIALFITIAIDYCSWWWKFEKIHMCVCVWFVTFSHIFLANCLYFSIGGFYIRKQALLDKRRKKNKIK